MSGDLAEMAEAYVLLLRWGRTLFNNHNGSFNDPAKVAERDTRPVAEEEARAFALRLAAREHTGAEVVLTIGSLFSGVGGLDLGLELAGFGPVLWQVEKDEWRRSKLELNWPGVRRFSDVCEVSAECLEPVDILAGGFPCFPAGTLIDLAGGELVDIEDVKIGDSVITHNGRLRNVVATMRRDDAPLCRVTAGASTIITTSEHPFYTLGDGLEPRWVAACDLRVKDLVAMITDEQRRHLSASPKSEGFCDGGLFWVPVRGVRHLDERATVYNFEVDEDNSYVADSFVVHNCQDVSSAGKGAGLGGARSGL